MTAAPTTANVGRRVVMATATIMGAYGLAKLVGFARQILVARAFGTSWQYDAYSAAFEPADVLFTVISVGALGTAFIPVFAGFLDRDDRRPAHELASSILTLTFVVGVALALVLAILAQPVVAVTVGRGFDPARRALTVDLLRIILLGQILLGTGGVINAILNAHQHFLLPAIAPAFYNVGIIVGAVALAPRWGIYGLAWGVVLGACFSFLIQAPGLLRFGVRYRPRLGLAVPAVRQVGWLMLPRILSLGLFNLVMLMNGTLASSLEVGSVSALFIGWQVMQLPETIFATAVATAVFPTMAEMASRGQLAALRSTMAATVRAIATLTIPTAVGLIVLAQPLVQVMFQRGAFDANSTRLVVLALRFWALGLVAHSSLEIVARTFYAMKDTRTPLYVATVSLIANLLMSLALRGPLGVGGLALANSIAFTFEAIILLWLLRTRVGGVEGRRLASAVGRMVISAAAMGVLVFLVTHVLESQRAVVVGIAGGVVGAVVYLALVLALGLEEARLLPRLVMARLRPTPSAPVAGD